MRNDWAHAAPHASSVANGLCMRCASSVRCRRGNRLGVARGRVSSAMECNVELAQHLENFRWSFLGSHIVVDLDAARWSTTEINKLWLDCTMNVAPLAVGLSRSRTTEQDISWLLVGISMNESHFWPLGGCPRINGVPGDLIHQARSIQS